MENYTDIIHKIDNIGRNSFILKSIDFSDKYYLKFKKNFELPITRDLVDKTQNIDCTELSIYLGEFKTSELKKEIIIEFQTLWKMYVLCSESELSEDAKILRRRLNTIIRQVRKKKNEI